MEDGVFTDQKMDDLQHSLGRLREFVGGLEAERVVSVPVCVEEYCDKVKGYRLRDGLEVLLVA